MGLALLKVEEFLAQPYVIAQQALQDNDKFGVTDLWGRTPWSNGNDRPWELVEF